jgi:hypothetical protein
LTFVHPNVIIVLSKGNTAGKRRKGGCMVNIMTDKQIEIILALVADKFSACKSMEDVQKAIGEVKEMAKKEKNGKTEG